MRDLHGRWWVPEHADASVGGILHIEPNGSSELRLFGELVPGGGPINVVLGETQERGAVTISEAYLLSSREGQESTIGQTLSADGVLIGGQLPDGAASKFRRVSVETAMMPFWIRKPNPHISRLPGRHLRIDVALPEALACDIEGLGTVTLWWQQSEAHGVTSAAVELRPMFVLDALEAISTERAWEEFVTPILLLVALATGSPDRLARVFLTLESGSHPPTEIEMVAPAWSGPLIEPWRRVFGPLLPFADLEAQFSDAMCRWFMHFREARSALLTFFTVILNRSPYVEDSFSQVVRSLEAWHRAVDDTTCMPDAEFRNLMAELKTSFSGSRLEFLRMRLRYGNELTLKQRLDAILGEAGPMIADRLEDFPKFSRRVVETRNMLAHRAQIGDAFTHEEMAAAQTLLQVALEVTLLRRMGFPGDAVEEHLRDTPEWRWLGARDNPLTRPSGPQARS